MNVRTWTMLALLATLHVGCGKQETPPAAARPADNIEQLATDTQHAVERQARRVQDDWDRFARDAKGEVQRSRDKIDSQLKKQHDEMAEFAAQMAEDAKDRALDIPDVLDEFFGAPTDEQKRRSPGDRTESRQR